MPNRALQILIVEDQFLIAKQLEVLVSALGHRVVGVSGNRNSACSLAESMKPDIIFVDISLADGLTGIDVAAFVARQCESHVVFTTANRRRLPHDYCGAIGVVEKPFTRSGLVLALSYVAARLSGASSLQPLPGSLMLSPHYKTLWN